MICRGKALSLQYNNKTTKTYRTMANLAEQLREEKLQKVDFQKYLDYVADKIRNNNVKVTFSKRRVGYNVLAKDCETNDIEIYDDFNLAEALVKKFRSEGFDVYEYRLEGFGRELLEFTVGL